MKSTGIVRRIDDLGRVVIPKEIRRDYLKVRDGDPLEIYCAYDKEDGEPMVVFKRYDPANWGTRFQRSGTRTDATVCRGAH